MDTYTLLERWLIEDHMAEEFNIGPEDMAGIQRRRYFDTQAALQAHRQRCQQMHQLRASIGTVLEHIALVLAIILFAGCLFLIYLLWSGPL